MKYCCKYSNHYVGQSGGGKIPIFYGSRAQSGHGLGSLFSSIALPFIRPLLPHLKSAARYLGRKALDTGGNIIGDVIGGRNIGESAKDRFKETGRDILTDVRSTVQSGTGRNKRKITKKKSLKMKKKQSTKTQKKRRKIIKTILD